MHVCVCVSWAVLFDSRVCYNAFRVIQSERVCAHHFLRVQVVVLFSPFSFVLGARHPRAGAPDVKADVSICLFEHSLSCPCFS